MASVPTRAFAIAPAMGSKLVLASIADEPVLEAAQARQVAGALFEDRLVPEHRAGGVAPRSLVDVGEALVRFDAGLGVFRWSEPAR